MAGVCVAGGVHGRGMHGRGDVQGRQVHVWQGGMRGRRDGHCSRRYASYWNAFLLRNVVSSRVISPEAGY